MPQNSRQVFFNVPFDPRYRKLFRALVFAVHDCGFTSRCALEQSDSAQVRLDKLYRLIESCQFGLHDLSRTSLDRTNRLPRFNMPVAGDLPVEPPFPLVPVRPSDYARWIVSLKPPCVSVRKL